MTAKKKVRRNRNQKHSGRADLYTKSERQHDLATVEHLRLKDSITSRDSEHTRNGLLGNTLWADKYFQWLNHDRLAGGAGLVEIALESEKVNRDYLIAMLQGAILSHPDSHRIEGQWLATLRTSNGMTQEDLGDRLGIKKNSVARWEGGMRPVNKDRQKDLRRIFIPLWQDDVASWEMACVLHDLRTLHANGEMPPDLKGIEPIDWLFEEFAHSPTVRLARHVIPQPPWITADPGFDFHDYEDEIAYAPRKDEWWPDLMVKGIYQLPPKEVERPERPDRPDR